MDKELSQSKSRYAKLEKKLNNLYNKFTEVSDQKEEID